MTFYHGSPIANIAELSTLSYTHDESKKSAVYLTPNRAYALFYIRDLDINYVTCGVTEEGFIRYDERFLDQLKKLYSGRSGYLYTCADDSNYEKTNTRDVWVSKEPVKIISSEFISDVYKELQKYIESGVIRVARYETLSETEKEDIYNMTVWSLYRSGLTEKDTPKANFYCENFSEAWCFVKAHPELKQQTLDEWDLNHKG